MINNKSPERRRSERVDYPFEIWYKDRNRNNQGFKHAYGKNLSEHGLLFETYENFPPCTILEIRIELPVSEISREFFNILVEVVRTEEIKRQWLYHIGVSFCKIDNDCRIFLKKYISSQLNPLRQPVTPPSDEKDAMINREVFIATKNI